VLRPDQGLSAFDLGFVNNIKKPQIPAKN